MRRLYLREGGICIVRESGFETAWAGKAPYLIAEIGSNHNGKLSRAKRMMRSAASSGADAVKFQLFTLPQLIQPENYEKALALESSAWRSSFRKLEFKLSWLPELKRLADRLDVDFLCTPFDAESLAAYTALKPAAIKIASGDITHTALLRQAAASGIPVILSTGASTTNEIEKAVAITGKEKTALLDCVMSYPAPASAYSPERLSLLRKYCRITGVSDHTEGVALAAEAMLGGAVVIEKHFTLNRALPGADHAHSSEPKTFAVLKSIMLETFQLRAHGRTRPQDGAERIYARRAVYARVPIAQGEIFSEKNCIALRPALENYVPASSWDDLTGKAAKKSYTGGMGIEKQEFFTH